MAMTVAWNLRMTLDSLIQPIFFFFFFFGLYECCHDPERNLVAFKVIVSYHMLFQYQIHFISVCLRRRG
jgi:hypothetical protein